MLDSTYELVIIRAPRRIDTFTIPPLTQDFEAKISEGGAIVLDLSHTKSVEPDSADVILQGLMLAKQRQAQFSLRGVSPQVKTVLEMAGILRFFRKT
jgi:anti-anti-sigma regulatory factor